MPNQINLFNQSLNNDVWNFSDGQIAVAHDIEAQEDFNNFVSCNYPNNETPGYVRKAGPYCILWCNTDGVIRAKRVAVSGRVLSEA